MNMQNAHGVGDKCYTHEDVDRDLNALYRSDREEQATRVMRYIERLEAENAELRGRELARGVIGFVAGSGAP